MKPLGSALILGVLLGILIVGLIALITGCRPPRPVLGKPGAVSFAAADDDGVPTFPEGPLFLEWEPSGSEGQADDIAHYQIIKPFMNGWMDLGVTIPSRPTYRVQFPPELLWVGWFHMGFRACTTAWHCSEPTWLWFEIVPATDMGTPAQPSVLRIGPPPPPTR